MKKLLYLLPATLIFLASCGGGGENANSEEGTEETTEAAVTADGEPVDLGDYGMPFTITVPAGSDIRENDWGGVEVRSGEGFMISLEFGEGNIELLKSDLNDDAVFQSEILEEGENYIIYKRTVAGDDSVQPQVHFFYVFNAGEDMVEVKNLMDAEFGEDAIRKMLASAQSLSAGGA